MMSPPGSIGEKLAYIGFPKVFCEIARTYFRIELEGIEHIPTRGKAIVVPNHSGCTGLDAMMLSHVIHKELKRVPRVLTLWNLIRRIPFLSEFAQKMGARPASFQEGLNLLRKNCLTILFPEGIGGSYKPSSQRYRLQPFHTSFVSMALLSQAPIIPCIIIGAEESNINLGMLNLEKILKGASVPLPLNMIPLPAKWKIRFLPPVDLGHLSSKDVEQKIKMEEIAEKTRLFMQRKIRAELSKRKYIYFGNTPQVPISLPDGIGTGFPHFRITSASRNSNRNILPSRTKNIRK